MFQKVFYSGISPLVFTTQVVFRVEHMTASKRWHAEILESEFVRKGFQQRKAGRAPAAVGLARLFLCLLLVMAAGCASRAADRGSALRRSARGSSSMEKECYYRQCMLRRARAHAQARGRAVPDSSPAGAAAAVDPAATAALASSGSVAPW